MDDVLDQRFEVLPDRSEVERLVALEVRDPEAAAEIEIAQRRRCVLGEPQRQLDRLALRLAQQLRVEILRSREDVKAQEFDVDRGELGEQRGDLLGVDAELLRSAAHSHARALEREVRVDPYRHPRADAEAVPDGGDAPSLGLGLHLDRDAGRDRLGQFRRRSFRARRS